MTKVREFAHPNISGGWFCPICKTSVDKPVVLVGIAGTESDGVQEADQIHTKCFRLLMEMRELDVEIEPAII